MEPSAQSYLAPGITLAVVCVALFGLHRLLERSGSLAGGAKVRNQVLMLALTVLGALLVIFTWPMSSEMRGQVLTFLAALFSAAIALSSTTFLGNLFAGVMMRAVRNFEIGDFVRVGEHFGRVSERGLFHTEIQTEDRDLTTLPNLHLATNPVTVVRSSGTILSACVSLGYDAPRTRVEELLGEAARSAGLSEPFVEVRELGDFSVTYRIAGLLTEVKHIVSARSRLRCAMLDALHEGGIEIVSPTFMNTRALDPSRPVVPAAVRPASRVAASAPEAMIFDKAEEAASLESLRHRHEELEHELRALEGTRKEATDAQARARLDAELEARRDRLARLRELIERRESESRAKD